MYTEIIVRYLHFIGIFTWVSALAAQWLLLQPVLTRRAIQRLAKIDMVYGLSAVLVVGMGLTLWFGVGKPAEFYNTNGIFHLKVTLAVLVGLLSIIPTIFFARQRKGNAPEELVEVPAKIKRIVTLELILMAIIPLLATLMAAGIGQ